MEAGGRKLWVQLVKACPELPCEQQASRALPVLPLPAGTRIGAVRVSAYGWAARILRSLQQVLDEHHPFLLMLEWHPAAMDAASREELAPLLQWLADRGWARVMHTGPACRSLWEAGEVAMRHRWPEEQPLNLNYTMAGECALPPYHFDSLRLPEDEPTVFFVTRPLFE